MELSKNFEPGAIEIKWTKHWKEQGYFRSVPDSRQPYTVVIPPPNVTGVLHMGHTLNETVQDILVRKARMSGFNACWVPGSDHASIATEAKVVQLLKEKGIDKNAISREEFLKYAYEWKDKYGNIIYSQIDRLGCSVDWERVTFTMDDDYYRAVIKVFVDLFNKGLIYRGARMINWDPGAKTALSDEEVEYKETAGKLYYVSYKIVDEKGDPVTTPSGLTEIHIATQRPETIMGDTAVCVHPADERYAALAGKFVIVPLVNRKVPIIFDEYVDPAFGTGALKITPAHDINDYNLGLKHNLPVIDTLNEDGTLSQAAEVFVGLDRFAARKKIIEKLKEDGLLVKEEEYTTRVGYSQRTNAVVEPRISTQWFVKMKELAGPALQEVTQGKINIHPGDKFLATYKYWLDNVKDWCISRQLWWGQRIPAWYDQSGNMYVAETEEEIRAKSGELRAASLRQDEDVLDTWFSSWLWPIQVFKGITEPGNKDISYYYPTSVLVTGQDIIFFWVARMIMAGMEYMHEKPFSDVYFTGMVRDKQGRKMSKQLGNSPDLLELIDKYGADAVRFGIMISSPAGNDLLFDENSCEQGRNFNNKIWNALKLIKQVWKVADRENYAFGFNKEGELPEISTWIPQPNSAKFAISWFENRLFETQNQLEKLFNQFKISEALKTIYILIWDDFCSSYLEWVKPEFGEKIDFETYDVTINFLESLMALLHPFMPFITEEVNHILNEKSDALCIKQLNSLENPNPLYLEYGKWLKKAISSILDAKNKNQLKAKDEITLYIDSSSMTYQLDGFDDILKRQIRAKFITRANLPPEKENLITVVVESSKLYIISEKHLDSSKLKAELQKDLDYQKGFLASVEKKLGNERFVMNAKPEVIEIERRKKADAEEKIKIIEESLAQL